MTEKTGLGRIFDRNFLEYASYVIKERAIPDDADGLKPVQRRILWSLFEMDDGRFSKVANVIGHCMKYHPHGDRSIGDALVTLANRGYFIERQGNFGNIFTGDDASAARYIECRLTKLARETMFNKRITDFVPSYDGRNNEPLLLPAKLPVILLLGVEGIAVGMSTKILPHNFVEVLQAQVKCLKEQDFELYPDFQQGGGIDVSDYDDGRGKVSNRARIEKDGQKNLIIKELPWGTTTESVINSIELAARNGRIKISSIDDYTTDKVEINIRLARGVSVDEGLKRLYAHTECERSHTSNIVVIEDGNPIETTITELVHYCTGRLVEILKLELKLELGDLKDRFHWLSLEQIFIENRLYREIEECESWEMVRSTVRESLRPFIEEAKIEITEDDIDKLLSLKIRRISKYDMNAHNKEMGDIKKRMKEVRADLKNIAGYAIAYLEKLLIEHGDNYPRLTSIEGFTDIDVKEVAIRNLKAGYNSETGLIGTSIKGEFTYNVSDYDRFVIFLKDGTYRVIPMQEKYFIDGKPLYVGVLDKETVFTAVYKEKDTTIAYIKRFNVDSFILDKEYRICSEGSEVIFLTNKPEMQLDYWFVRTKRMRARKGDCLISEFKVTSSGAKGVQLCGRKLISSFKTTEVEVKSKSSKEELPKNGKPKEKPVQVAETKKKKIPPKKKLSVDEVIEKAEELHKRASETIEKAESKKEEDTPRLF